MIAITAFMATWSWVISPVASAGLTAFIAWRKKVHDTSENGQYMKKPEN